MQSLFPAVQCGECDSKNAFYGGPCGGLHVKLGGWPWDARRTGCREHPHGFQPAQEDICEHAKWRCTAKEYGNRASPPSMP